MTSRVSSLATFIAVVALAALAACSDDGGAADAAPIDSAPAGGTFSLAWTLADLEGDALDCDDVAGATISVAGTPIDAVAGFSESFTCGTGSGTSGQIAAGTYNLSIDLRAAGAAGSLLASPVVLSGVEIASGGNTDGLAAGFEVAPIGNLSFRVDAQGDGANCASFEEGGGAIEGLRFELTDRDGACVDGVDLAVAEGAGDSGTYTTDCAAPPNFGCVDAAQVISIVDQRSGPYALSVTGFKTGDLPCYTRVSNFKLPGNDLALDLGALPLTLAATVECDPSLLPDAGPL